MLSSMQLWSDPLQGLGYTCEFCVHLQVYITAIIKFIFSVEVVLCALKKDQFDKLLFPFMLLQTKDDCDVHGQVFETGAWFGIYLNLKIQAKSIGIQTGFVCTKAQRFRQKNTCAPQIQMVLTCIHLTSMDEEY